VRAADADRAERERILLPSWQPVCHDSDLPSAGTAIRFDFLSRSALVLRGSDGLPRAFLNACRHRGSRLIEGDPSTAVAFCIDSKLRCPYHAWVYDDRGALVHVPREDQYPGIDRARLGLHALPLATWHGFVFVAFETPPRPLAEMLAACTDELGAHRLDAMRRISEPRLVPHRADWKVVCEHQLELQRRGFAPAESGADTDLQRHRAAIVASDAGNWPARAYASWLPDVPALPADRRRSWSRYFLWPNVALDVYPDQVAFAQVLPLGPGESAVRELGYALPDSSREMRLARYLNARIRRRFATEDRRLVERRQLGLDTCGDAPGPLANDEPGQRWFTARVAAALQAPRRRVGRAPRAR